MPSVSVGTTPVKIVNANRFRTALTINNIDGNNAVFLLDNIALQLELRESTGLLHFNEIQELQAYMLRFGENDLSFSLDNHYLLFRFKEPILIEKRRRKKNA